MCDTTGFKNSICDVIKLFLECPIGYHLNNCSEKCSIPTFGEECQFLCDCPDYDCHFARGCLNNLGSVTNTQLKSMMYTLFDDMVSIDFFKVFLIIRVTLFCFHFTDYTMKFTHKSPTLSNFRSSNVAISYSMVTESILDDNDKFSETTLTNYPQDIDVFKNNFVVHVVISFMGVFIFFFASCVLTYIYFKCCPKRRNYGSGMEENKLQTRYNSLNFVAEEPEATLNVEAQDQEDNKDFTYLTPVYNSNESTKSGISSEDIARNENEAISSENQLIGKQTRRKASNRQNLPNFTKEDVQEHIYIEISEDNQER